MTEPIRRSRPDLRQGLPWRVKLAVALLILLAVGVVLVTNRWLTDRFVETTRNRAEVRLALLHRQPGVRIAAHLGRAAAAGARPGPDQRAERGQFLQHLGAS
jgi:hypothetical protein